MNKYVKYFSVLGIFGVVTACTSQEKDSSQESWPMSGGPNGTWSINTENDVPTEWSVRTGENIKWRTELPEGGQSGIAVWGDQLFLTINPPMTTKPYAELEARYKDVDVQYKKLYASTEKKLIDDLSYKTKVSGVEKAQKQWLAFFAKRTAKMPAHQKSRAKRKLMGSSEQGKGLTKASRSLTQYVYSKNSALPKLNDARNKASQEMRQSGSSADIILVSLDRHTGDILWQRTVKGITNSGYHYGFSDSTTPCPLTDGEYVWAINASGGIACFDFEGNEKWSRTWEPTGGRPFNKQFDSILSGDSILNVEPPEKGDTSRVAEWNYLRAIDKNTGKTQWVCKDALTHYNTPVLGEMPNGNKAVLIGRGGPHGVPERPVGLSMVSLEAADAGEVLWRWEPEGDNKNTGWGALSTQHWDKERAYWFLGSSDMSHTSIDVKTGKEMSSFSLKKTDKSDYDPVSQTYKKVSGYDLEKNSNQRHCNVVVGDHLYYLMRYEPYLVRHNVKTGKTEHLELPTEVIRTKGQADKYVWRSEENNSGLNAQGQRHGADARTRGDGNQKCFLGSPTVVNDKIYFTNALGLTFVIDSQQKELNKNSLIAVNDLGARGETWSVNSLSYANGNIYHRDMKAVVCIGE